MSEGNALSYEGHFKGETGDQMGCKAEGKEGGEMKGTVGGKMW
jgi:hypothetical protein